MRYQQRMQSFQVGSRGASGGSSVGGGGVLIETWVILLTIHDETTFLLLCYVITV